MGLTATAASAARAGFNAAGDAKTTVQLLLNPTGTSYDPATDTETITYAQDTAGVEAIAYDDQKIGDKIGQTKIGEKRTKSFLVLGASITVAEPNQEGRIIHGATVWQIASVESDPTNAIYTFHCIA